LWPQIPPHFLLLLLLLVGYFSARVHCLPSGHGKGWVGLGVKRRRTRRANLLEVDSAPKPLQNPVSIFLRSNAFFFSTILP
jgi:hypothetical protein